MSALRAPRVLVLVIGVSIALCSVCGLVLQARGALAVFDARVVAAVPQASDILPTSPITVTFLSPMNRSSVERAFKTSPPLQGEFRWTDDHTVVFKSTTLLPLSTTVTVEIVHDARSWLNRPLDHDFSWSFTTLAPPQIINRTPAPGARFAYLPNRLGLTFSREMDHASVESRLAITPPIANPHLEWHAQELEIRGALKPSTLYKITLRRGAQDAEYGMATEQDWAWSFTTTEQYPYFGFTQLGHYSLVPADQPSALKIQFLNCSRFESRLYTLDLDAFLETFSRTAETWGEFSPAGAPLRAWSTETRAAADKFNTTDFKLDALPAGIYYLTVNTPEGMSDSRILIATKTALTVKRAGDSVLIWATQLGDGAPVADLALSFYDSQGKKVGAGRTDPQGLFEGELQASSVRVVGTRAGDFAAVSEDWQQGIELWHWQGPAILDARPSPGDGTLELSLDRESYLNGDAMNALVRVPGGSGQKVQWRLFARDFVPDFAGGRDSDSAPADENPPADQEIASGEGVLDAQGELKLKSVANLQGETSQIYTLQASVFKADGQLHSNSASAPVHRGNFYITARPVAAVANTGQEASFQIQTFDKKGQSLGRLPLTYVLTRIAWDCGTRTDPQARQLYSCDPLATRVQSGKVTTDVQGAAQLRFTPLHAGEYQLELQGRDARGNTVLGRARVWIAAPDEFAPWKFEQGNRLVLTPDQKSYAPGDTIKLLVQSPYKHAIGLVTVERERILGRQVVTLNSNSAVVEIPVTEEFQTGVYVSMVVVSRDGQAPSFRMGYTRVSIAASPKGFELGGPMVETAQTLTLSEMR